MRGIVDTIAKRHGSGVGADRVDGDGIVLGVGRDVRVGRLLEEAERVAKEKGFEKLAVIAAVGTRQYYLDRGFERGEYYLVKAI